MAFRSARLNAILGSAPETVTYGQLAGLVANEAAGEAEELDYKLRYETGEKGSDDVAVDIATFANHRGGVIVVGMAEVNARPSKVVGVELTDELERWIRTKAAERIFPMPLFELRPVADPDGDAQKPTGLMLIIVPPSSSAPHAVVVPKEKGKLRWPRRHGTTKIWLSESEIAAAYRRRFVAVADQNSRMGAVQADVIAAIGRMDKKQGRDPGALLIVSLVPDFPGDLVIDRNSYTRFQREIQQQLVLVGSDGMAEMNNAAVGQRRLVCYDDGWFNRRAELHSDGSGAIAVQLPREGTDTPARIWDTSIVLWVASALRYLARHARDRAGASGIAATTASLRSYAPLANAPNVLGGEMVILTFSAFGTGNLIYGAEPQAQATGQADFLLDDLADDGQPLASATAVLAGDLFQAFNAVGIQQITREGVLQQAAWGSDWEYIKTWASDAGVPTNPPQDGGR